MKATGIVRRIDDLGRVVIPKEIRRTMQIREGDPLEIFTEHDGYVIFKKYSPVGEIYSFAEKLCEALYKSTSLPIVICDRDIIIASSGVSKKEFIERKLSNECERILENRVLYTYKQGDIPIDISSYYVGAMMPVIVSGDIAGGVILLKSSPSAVNEFETKITQIAAGLLSKLPAWHHIPH